LCIAKQFFMPLVEQRAFLLTCRRSTGKRDVDDATAFHTAARRYCENKLLTSPDYGFAEEALVEIEKLIPAQFQSMEDLRPLLLRAGELAQENHTRRRKKPWPTKQAVTALIS
jgi:hypothetical protein